MEAIEYLKEKARMTNGCLVRCRDCPLGIEGCADLERDNPERAVEIVENWAKENPVKTFKDVLLEKLPKAVLDEDGTPAICPHNLFGGKKWDKCKGSTFGGCEICWNREYKEEANEN